MYLNVDEAMHERVVSPNTFPLDPLPHNTAFDALKVYSVTSNFCFFHNVFYPKWCLFSILHALLNCYLQFVSIWTSLKFCCLVMG